MGRMMKYLLGGDSQPMAGDGYGLVTKSSPVDFRPVDYNKAVETKGSPAPEGFTFVDTKPMNSPKTVSSPVPPSPGIRPPRCSVLTDVSVSSPRIMSPSLDPAPETPITSPKPDSDPIDQTPWQDYEIPEELGIVREDAPKEIQNIIQESLDERRAMRASRLHAQSIVVQTRIETSRARRKTNEHVIAESSSHISAKSTPASDSETRSGSSLSMESATTVDSDIGLGLLQVPKPFVSPGYNSSSQSLRSQKSLQSLRSETNQPSSPKPVIAPSTPSMAAIESKLQESKARTTKSRKLFKLLPARKTKAPTASPNHFHHFHQTEPKTYECTSCFDEIPRKTAIAGLPCNHKYCLACFSQLVSTAIHSEDTFPPKCCLQEIPKTLLRTHLAPKELSTYNQRALEYAVPIANRYYCVHAPCARWIDTRHAKRTNGALACPHCQTKLCLVCRGPSHPSNQDCPQDYGLSSTLEHAELAGWQRCYNCRALVERNQGCRHITCKCRAEFCYTCGSRWRTCQCTEADQLRRDEERAVRLSQRDADARREEEEVQAAIAAVEAAERQLQEERDAEESRLAAEAADLTRREADRVARVTAHFSHLREVLESVRFQQRSALSSRHEADEFSLKELERRQTHIIAGREREILAEKRRLVKEGEALLGELRRNHAVAMMETIARHRADQDALLVADISHRVSRNPYAVGGREEVLRAEMLEALLPVQELERATLKAMQGREVAKWRGRGEERVRGFDDRMLVLRVRLEEAEKVKKSTEDGRRNEYSDWMWFESLFEDRVEMLREDEAKVVRSGGDVPTSTPVVRTPGLGRVRTPDEEMKVEVAQGVRIEQVRISDGDLGEYVRLRGWGTPSLGLGWGRECAVGG